MLCGRNDEQREGHPVSSTWKSSSEDPCSSSYAVKCKNQFFNKINNVTSCLPHHIAWKGLYLEHFDRKYSVIGCFHLKCADICDYDLYILQLKIPTNWEQNSLESKHIVYQLIIWLTLTYNRYAPALLFYESLLCCWIANPCNLTVAIFLCNVQRQRSPATPNIKNSVTIFYLWPFTVKLQHCLLSFLQGAWPISEVTTTAILAHIYQN